MSKLWDWLGKFSELTKYKSLKEQKEDKDMNDWIIQN